MIECRFFLSITVVLALSLGFCPSEMPCLAADNVTKATELYKSGRNEEALPILESELNANPKNARAHYLLGNVLVTKKFYTDALEEYGFAAALDPEGPVGRYSKQEIARLEEGFKRARAAAAAPAQSGTPDGEAKGRAMSQSVSAANRQAEEEGLAVSQECERKLEQLRRESADRVRLLRAQLNEDLSRAIKGTAISRDEINAIYKTRIDNEQASTERTCAEVTATYQARLQAMQDEVSNLGTGFAQNGSRSHFRLNPIGTNMHVHNYETQSGTAAANVHASDVPKSGK